MERNVKNPRYVLGVRLSALIEMALFFLPAVGLDAWLGDGTRFFEVTPHPFWVIMLLIVVQYGTNEGLICALVSSFFLLAWNIPDQHFNENLYDYLFRISLNPLLWLSAAVILGQIRMRHVLHARKLTDALSEAKEREKAITDAYSRVKEIKEMLEIRLASQVKSNSAAYSAFRSIEMLDRKSILLGVEDMIRAVMDPPKFSIYTLGETGFESIVCTGWGDEETYARRFTADSNIYQELAGRKRALCVINEEDAAILGKEGVMAAPLIDSSTGRIFGMMKIEELHFTELSLSNVETFRVLCELVGMAYANAERFDRARENSLLNQDTGLLSWQLFKTYRSLLARLDSPKSIALSLIAAHLKNAEQFPKEKRHALIVGFAHAAADALPKDASIFSGQHADSEVIMLLPRIPAGEAHAFAAAIAQALRRSGAELAPAEWSLDVKHIDEETHEPSH